jgi:hypothetical protein
VLETKETVAMPKNIVYERLNSQSLLCLFYMLFFKRSRVANFSDFADYDYLRLSVVTADWNGLLFPAFESSL